MPSLDTHLHASASSCGDPEPGEKSRPRASGEEASRRFAEIDESSQVALSVNLDHRAESAGLRESFAGASPRGVGACMQGAAFTCQAVPQRSANWSVSRPDDPTPATPVRLLITVQPAELVSGGSSGQRTATRRRSTGCVS